MLARQEWHSRAAHRRDCLRSLAACRGTCGTLPKLASGSQASRSTEQISTSPPPKLPINTPINCENFRPEFFGVRPGVLILLWSPAPK